MTESNAATMRAEAPAVAAPRPAPAAADRLLLERHLAGDREAFAALVRLHASAIYGYLARCGVGADCDDLFQEVFLRVHRASGASLPHGATVKPWLFGIAVNVVRSHFRRQRARATVPLHGELGAESAAARAGGGMAAPSPFDHATASLTGAWLEGEIARLPLPQREAVLLCCVEGIEQAAAARTLALPLNTLKTQLRRGRLALARAVLRREETARREVGP